MSSGEEVGSGGPPVRRVQAGDAAAGDTSLHPLLPGCRVPAFFYSMRSRPGSLRGLSLGVSGTRGLQSGLHPKQPVTSEEGV